MAVTATELAAPPREEMRLEAVFHALSDPVRLHIVRTLAGDGQPRPCGTFDLPVSKSTASHHFRVLREAGVIAQIDEGRMRLNQLRSEDLDARFPGLLATVTAGS